MKYLVFRDDHLQQALDYIDKDIVAHIMRGRAVNVSSYNQFISGDANTLESDDEVVEIVNCEYKYFAGVLKQEVARTKKHLQWLESLQEEHES